MKKVYRTVDIEVCKLLPLSVLADSSVDVEPGGSEQDEDLVIY